MSHAIVVVSIVCLLGACSDPADSATDASDAAEASDGAVHDTNDPSDADAANVVDAADADAADADVSARCAVPAGAHPSVGPAVPRAGLSCIRYPATAIAPRDVIVAEDGTIFVSEMGAGRISRFRDGAFEPFAEGLVSPIGIRELPGGDLLVAEENRQAVARIDRTTGLRTPLAEGLRNTTYLTLGPDGAAYVSAFGGGSALVWRIDVMTGETSEFATGLRLAEGLYFDVDASLVVAEYDPPSAVMRYPAGGGATAELVAMGFEHVYGLLRDLDGGVLVADHAGRIVRIGLDGTTIVLLDGIGRAGGMAFDPEGDLLITEFVDFGTPGYLIRLTGL